MSPEGAYRVLAQDSWARREQYELFRGLEFPYFSLTADVDITAYRRALRKGARFTIGLVHALSVAANAVAPFRQRIRGADVIEFDTVHPSIIVLTDDEAFRFCWFAHQPDFAKFSRDAPARIEQARNAPTLFTLPDQDDFLFMTAIPWVSFTGLTHATPVGDSGSIPRIAWGKYRAEGRRVVLPLNVQVHHALVDGIHVGRFYARVEEILAHADDWLV